MNQNPIILQVLPALEMGGVERGTIEIATALTEAGIQNYVVSSGGPMVQDLTRLGVQHITLPVQTKNPFSMWKNAQALAHLVKEKGITLMHVRSRAPAWSVKWASWLSGVPYMGTFHGVYGIRPAIKKLYNRALMQGVITIAVSDYVKQHMIDAYGANPQSIIRVHRGADMRQFNLKNVSPDRIEKLRQTFHIPTNKPIICLPGRLSKVKGHAVLLEALTHMKHQEITCLLVGSDQGNSAYTESLKPLISQLPPQITLLMTGPCHDMPALYALCDIMVNARITPEAFGRTIPEAQAMGCLVVATKLGGPSETICHGKTGFHVAAHDPMDLARTLDYVLELSPAEKEAIRQAAMTSAQQDFSIQKMCEQTIDIYKMFSK